MVTGSGGSQVHSGWHFCLSAARPNKKKKRKKREMLLLGLRYFAGVFAVGFALGTIRTLWLVPRVGELLAVTAEMPFILAASWWWCGRLLAQQPLGLAGRAVMGGSAFTWLMLAELALGRALGRTPVQHFAAMISAAGLLGLAGQLGFAAMPMFNRSRG